MAIVRWNRSFPSIFEEDWFEPTWFSTPGESGLDVYETEDSVVVEAQVPGIPEEDIDISVEGNVLTVEASSEETKEEKEEKKAIYRETRQRAFRYSVNLPRGVNSEKAEASMDQGILKVEIPIAEEEKRKKIEVKPKK
jgi:HSP20 family protein